MTNDAADLRERLEQLADAFGDPHHVDIGRACRRGRRMLLCRRAAVTLGGGVAVGLAGVLAISALPGQSGPKGPGSAVSLHPSALSAVYADPLSATVSLGKLPSGFRVDGYVADRQGRPYFQVEATDRGGTSIWLTAYGRGPQPGLPLLPGGRPATPVHAAAVHGRPAYWDIEPVAGAAAQVNFDLRWQYAPRSWADLQASGWSGVSSATLAADARKIAEAASFSSKGVPVAMPLHVVGVPGGLQPVRTVLNNPPDLSALVLYSGPGDTGSDSLQISVSSAVGPAGLALLEKKGLVINDVIDGFRAYDSQAGHAHEASAVLYVFGVHGLDVRIDASGAILRTLNRHGGLAGLFSRMTLYPTLSEWTVKPIN